MNQPKLSVVLPNYNHAKYLPFALEAILAQSYQPAEIVIVDDASTDRSYAILEEFARSEPLIRLSQNHRNMGVNWTAARLLDMATGDYIIFCAADDIVLPGLFEKSMDLLARYPRAGFCSAQQRRIDAEGKDLGVNPTGLVTDSPCFLPPERVRRLISSRFWVVMTNTAIYRRQAILEAGGFRSEVGCLSDLYSSWVVALRYGACFIPEPLGCFRVLDGSYGSGWHTTIEARREALVNSLMLMRTEHRDVFPEGFIAMWEDEMLYGMARMVQLKFAEQRTMFLDRLRTVYPTPCLSERLLVRFLDLAFRAQDLMLTCGLLLKHRPRYTLHRKLDEWRRKLGGGPSPEWELTGSRTGQSGS